MPENGGTGVLSRPFSRLVALNFVFFLCLALVSYVNSAFLSTFLESEWVSVAFMAQAALIIGALLALPRILRNIPPRRLMVLLVPVTSLSFALLGLAQTAFEAVTLFMFQGIGIYCLMYLLDLYLESITKDESTTGNVRGIFLTSGNLAVFLAPLLIILLVVREEYLPLYIFAAFALLLSLVVALVGVKRLAPLHPEGYSYAELWRVMRTGKASLIVTMAAYLLLWTFYSWVVIYAPLLLLEVGGYSWQVIGLVTGVALLPFLFLEVPLGKIADRYIGEKEIMSIGFAVLGAATVALAVIPLSLIVMWTIAFFLTRVGAAMVEITTETSFFRQVTENDFALVSLFRMIRSLGFIVGPAVAFFVLPLTGLQLLFAAFGVILLLGIPIALYIKDTK